MIRVVRYSSSHSWFVISIWLTLVAMALAVLPRLELRTSNLDLVSNGEPVVMNYLEFAHRFGNPNAIFVLVESDHVDRLETALLELGSALRDVDGVRAVLNRLPFDASDLEAAGMDPFLMTDDGGAGIIIVQPRDERTETARIEPLVAALKAIAGRPQWDDLKIGFTGVPVYAVDDKTSVLRDLGPLSGLSLLLVSVCFAVGFRAFRGPLMALLTLAVSLIVSAGLAALTFGYLTLVSAAFVSLVCGLGIDFSIHYLSVNDDGSDGRATAVVPSIGIAALTTIAGLVALQVAGLKGFSDLGVLCAIGLSVAYAATLTLLPALVSSMKRRVRMARQWRLPVVQSRGLALSIVVVLIAAFWALGVPAFDTDYRRIQPSGSATVAWEQVINDGSPLSTQFAALTAENSVQARRLSAHLEDLPQVASVMSLASLERQLGKPIDGPAWFVGMLRDPEGREAVLAFPRGDLWDPLTRREFLDSVRDLDPNLTGMPVLAEWMLGRMKRALIRSLIVALVAIALVLLLMTRRVRATIECMLPALLTGFAVPVMMQILGLRFNPINVLALPLIMGVAVDDGVHLVHAVRVAGMSVGTAIRSYGRGIALTTMTNLAAFGSLALARHRGLGSFGEVLVLGVGCAFLMSLSVLPALLAFGSPTERMIRHAAATG